MPCLFERFSLLFKGFQGFGRDKKSLFFWWFFRAFFQKRQGEEGQGLSLGEAQDFSLVHAVEAQFFSGFVPGTSPGPSKDLTEVEGRQKS